jgi:predicted unusual protein kinase regulating ubiquinone biosynthesis (AarF/ABC1/UbiB family)
LRADLIKVPEYVRELEKLQDAVGTFPTPVAMAIIKNELALTSPNELYDFTPPTPVASASIGQVGWNLELCLSAADGSPSLFLLRPLTVNGWPEQVYKAILRSTGAEVAVKVQRPDAFASAAVDMFILRR